MRILKLKAYCYTDEMAFQDDVPGMPVSPSKEYDVAEDEVIPEFDLGKCAVNWVYVNPDTWVSFQKVLVNDTPALILDFAGKEFYAPYTIDEFHLILQNALK